MKLYTPSEAAQIAGITRQRVHQLIKQGVISPIKKGRWMLIDAAGLRAIQKRNRTSPGRPKKDCGKSD